MEWASNTLYSSVPMKWHQIYIQGPVYWVHPYAKPQLNLHMFFALSFLLVDSDTFQVGNVDLIFLKWVSKSNFWVVLSGMRASPFICGFTLGNDKQKQARSCSSWLQGSKCLFTLSSIQTITLSDLVREIQSMGIWTHFALDCIANQAMYRYTCGFTSSLSLHPPIFHPAVAVTIQVSRAEFLKLDPRGPKCCTFWFLP